MVEVRRLANFKNGYLVPTNEELKLVEKAELEFTREKNRTRTPINGASGVKIATSFSPLNRLAAQAKKGTSTSKWKTKTNHNSSHSVSCL